MKNNRKTHLYSADFVWVICPGDYHGMKVGMPPICCVCRRGTDGPASGCAEAVCFECYELIRGKASYLRSLNDPPMTAEEISEPNHK